MKEQNYEEFMQKKLMIHNPNYNVYMDDAIDKRMQRVLYFFVKLIGRVDAKKQDKINFYFQNGYVYDKAGEWYLEICTEDNGKGVSEIKYSLKDFEDLCREYGTVAAYSQRFCAKGDEEEENTKLHL